MSEKPQRPRHKRLETLNLVSFTHKDQDGRVDLEIVGRTLDLSDGGILLEIPRPVPSDNKEVDVTLGIREHVIRIMGRIVHQRELENGHIGLGIAFTSLSEEDSAILSRFLSEDEV
ncbi:MAG: PilZ domain-containing protein [bacterium]|nr:MAG: PilZ domain-containing protein [bacterium]